MNDGFGRSSVLDEIVWIPDSPVQVLYWWAFPRGIYCKEDDYVVGASYLQVAIYMWWVFIFNHSIWWLVDRWNDLYTSWLSQTECLCSRTQWVAHVLCPLHCIIFFCLLWLDFLCAGSVCHAQYKQSCMLVSTLNPIFLVAYSQNRHCLLVGKKVVFCAFLKWFSSYVFFAMAKVSW